MRTNPTPASPAPDQNPITDLIRAAATGDGEAWAELVRRYTPLVRARMRTYRLQEADQFDVAQITWLRLAENLHRLHTPAHVGGWLATVVARECQVLARSAARSTATGDLMAATAADPAAGPEKIAVDRDVARRLWGAVAMLAPSRRDLVRVLFSDETGSYAEIARDIGIPIGSIGPTRGRALRELRTMLADDRASLSWS